MTKRAKKQVFKDKAQVIKELKKNVQFMDKMKFIRERFYPALCEATTSIEDASQLLSGFNTTIMQTFLEKMKSVQMNELELASKLDASSEKYKQMKTLLAMFGELNVFDAKDYIEGMRSEIQLFQKDEMENRPLSSLKTKWVDEL